MLSSDISVVIQGPVESSQRRVMDDDITHRCIASIRKYLPESFIILSTWPDQNLDGINVDKVVLNDDPGSNIVRYEADGTAIIGNLNRQIVSSLGGLKEVHTKYALKIRSDNYLTGNHFLSYWSKFTFRSDANIFFENRVVFNSSYFKKVYMGRDCLFHPSDFFQFGLTKDVIKVWDIPLFPDIKYDTRKVGQRQHPGYPERCLSAEQSFCQAWLKNLDGTAPEINYANHVNKELREYWEHFIASNLIILDPKKIGLGVLKRHEGVATNHWSIINHEDWKSLYARYCDPNSPSETLPVFFKYGIKRLFYKPIANVIHRIRHLFRY